MLGKYNFYKHYVDLFKNFKFLEFMNFFKMLWYILNVGHIGLLYLNGLGFKSTRKKIDDKKHWRFNVGHSHVFKYFPPNDVIVKIKTRLICIFNPNKIKVMDIINKLRSFHFPDSYKGVGLKYPFEVIRLKKGKTRQ